jgi:hypothetical protein
MTEMRTWKDPVKGETHYDVVISDADIVRMNMTPFESFAMATLRNPATLSTYVAALFLIIRMIEDTKRASSPASRSADPSVSQSPDSEDTETRHKPSRPETPTVRQSLSQLRGRRGK